MIGFYEGVSAIIPHILSAWIKNTPPSDPCRTTLITIQVLEKLYKHSDAILHPILYLKSKCWSQVQQSNTSSDFAANEQGGKSTRNTSLKMSIKLSKQEGQLLQFIYLLHVVKRKVPTSMESQATYTQHKHMYSKESHEEVSSWIEKVLEEWQARQLPTLTAIPDQGWRVRQLQEYLNPYSKVIETMFHKNLLAEPLPSHDLSEQDSPRSTNEDKRKPGINEPTAYFKDLMRKLRLAWTWAQHEVSWWNDMRYDSQSVHLCFSRQAIQMVAELFGGSIENVQGIVTSSVAGSLEAAFQAYRKHRTAMYGCDSQSTIVFVNDYIDLTISELCYNYEFNIKTIGLKNGEIDFEQMERDLELYSSNGFCLVWAMAPFLAFGNCDPIAKMSQIAQKYHCGMHVDCTANGILLNYLDKSSCNYLAHEGVSSLSADICNWAFEGPSVLITKKLGNQNLAGHLKPRASELYHVSALSAIFIMSTLGKEGYQHVAELLHEQTNAIATLVETQFQGLLQLYARPDVNIVSFRICNELGLEANEDLVRAMSCKNFLLRALPNNVIRLKVTMAFALEEEVTKNFQSALAECLKEM